LVVLWATPGNDFWENAFPDRSVTPQAGHLKPTFRLVNRELFGPYFTAGSYWHQSAIAQLVESALATIQKETLEQRILRSWLQDMPTPHERNTPTTDYLCEGLPVIKQGEFYTTIFELNNTRGYTIQSGEDFLNSRSHFATSMVDLSKRDEYLIAITESLLRHIKENVETNQAKFLVFYPVREDFDKRERQLVHCVSDSQGQIVSVAVDYTGLLQRVMSSNDLVIVDLPGGNDIVVSPADRHLNDWGNELAMKKLSVSLMERALTNQ